MYASVYYESESRLYAAIEGTGSQPYPSAESDINLAAKAESYPAPIIGFQRQHLLSPTGDPHKECTQIIVLKNKFLSQVFKLIFMCNLFNISAFEHILP